MTDVVYAGASGRLIVADIAVSKHKFWVIAVYAPNSAVERKSFFWQFGPYMAYLDRTGS